MEPYWNCWTERCCLWGLWRNPAVLRGIFVVKSSLGISFMKPGLSPQSPMLPGPISGPRPLLAAPGPLPKSTPGQSFGEMGYKTIKCVCMCLCVCV